MFPKSTVFLHVYSICLDIEYVIINVYYIILLGSYVSTGEILLMSAELPPLYNGFDLHLHAF